MGSSQTIDGICKLALYYVEDKSKEEDKREDQSKIKAKTCKAKVLDLTQQGELLFATEIELKAPDTPPI